VIIQKILKMNLTKWFNAILSSIVFLSLSSCGKKYNDETKKLIILEFITKLEEHELQYKHKFEQEKKSPKGY